MKTLLFLSLLTLSGCGAFDRFSAKVTGGATETCIHNVLYLQFTSGASVAYNTDGTVKKCQK
ncbi:MAG: hypothetical protein R8M45_03735 [Ghiorsea sp.]